MHRTVSGGQLGIDAKSLNNLDTLFVCAPGVRSEIHGVRQNTMELMKDLDIEGTIGAMERAGERHATMNGDLRPQATRATFKGMVKAIEITARHAGVLG